MKELHVLASLTKLDEVMSFLEEELDNLGCSMKTSMRIQVSLEELFVNIANYAYPDKEGGMASIQIDKEENPLAAVITLIDNGIPFNPLEKTDPDVTLSAEEREIGGLGIFMVKKNMDDVRYEYVNGENRLLLRKLL